MGHSITLRQRFDLWFLLEQVGPRGVIEKQVFRIENPGPGPIIPTMLSRACAKFAAFIFSFLLISVNVSIVSAGPPNGLAGRDVPVLLYHHIEAVDDSFSSQRKRWTITPEKFESQIQWLLNNGFVIVTLKEFFEALKKIIPLKDKTIVLTFDDGWKDHHSTVFPILKKYNLKATFFIIAKSVGSSSYMDWSQILAMEAAGMDMQSHSLTHPKLTAVSRKQAWKEISESKKVLDSRLKRPVTVFAYPYGSYEPKIIQMVKRAGYEGAVTVSGISVNYKNPEDKAFAYVRYALEGREDLEMVARLKQFYP